MKKMMLVLSTLLFFAVTNLSLADDHSAGYDLFKMNGDPQSLDAPKKVISNVN